MKFNFGHKKCFEKICTWIFRLVRNILANSGSEKPKESTGCVEIFRISGHQQPCRYEKKIEYIKSNHPIDLVLTFTTPSTLIRSSNFFRCLFDEDPSRSLGRMKKVKKHYMFLIKIDTEVTRLMNIVVVFVVLFILMFLLKKWKNHWCYCVFAGKCV